MGKRRGGNLILLENGGEGLSGPPSRGSLYFGEIGVFGLDWIIL